jgi:hypothetical protein
MSDWQVSGLALEALKYAKPGRSNSPSVMGNCPIYENKVVLRDLFFQVVGSQIGSQELQNGL